MRKYIYHSWMVIALFLAGCTDIIDVRPEDSTTFTNYFRTAKDAEALLNSLQYDLRQNLMSMTQEYNGYIIDTVKDNAIRSTRNLTPAQYKLGWEEYYSCLSSADIIIDNAHRFPLSEEIITPYVMQAYFAKAMIYFKLGRIFGKVPIRHNTQVYEKLPQSSIPEVLEYATQYGLKALELQKQGELKDDLGNTRTVRQYATKGAAAALLAHIYAWRATIEEKPEFWAEAEKYCTMIIGGDAGAYTLATDPESVCYRTLYGGDAETIWEIHRSPTEYGAAMAYYSEYFIGFPVRADKTPQANYTIEINKTTVRKMYGPEDQRRGAYFWLVDADTLYSVKNAGTGATVLVMGEQKGDTRKYYVWDAKTNKTEERGSLLTAEDEKVDIRYSLLNDPRFAKAFVTKFRFPYYTLNSQNREVFQIMNINRVWWRLADIYLLRAESRCRQGNRSGAIEDLNIIRERAYNGGRKANELVDKVVYAYPCDLDREQGIDQDLQMAIFREREKELIFEDGRYYDVIRNGWDYVRSPLMPVAFRRLTDENLLDGALYYGLSSSAFDNNDLIRQNTYWNKISQ